MQAPILEQLDSELGGSVRIGKVDVDEEPELARRFAVMSIPTLIAFRDGKLIEKRVGVTDAAGLKKHAGRLTHQVLTNGGEWNIILPFYCDGQEYAECRSQRGADGESSREALRKVGPEYTG